MEKELLKSSRDENNRYVFTVRVSPREFTAALDEARKVARSLLENNPEALKKAEETLAPDAFYPEAAQSCCAAAIEELIREQQLPVVGYPDILDCSTNAEGLLFTAALDAYPTVKLGDYKNIRVHIPEPVVEEAEVDLLLEDYVREASTRTELKRPAQDGDTVTIDLDGSLEEGPVPGGHAEDYTIVLGSHTFIPGLEAGMIGMKQGEKRDIPVTFPINYTPELAGRKAVFHVTMKSVCQIDVPEINDAFSQKYFECDLASLRADIRRNIELQKKAKHRYQQEETALSQAAGQMSCLLPESMIQQEIDLLTGEFSDRLEQEKSSLDQYLKSMQMSEEEFDRTARSSAVHRLRLDVVLKEIARVEHIVAEQADLDRTLELLAEQYGTTVEGVSKALTAPMIERETLRRKVSAFLLSQH